MLIPEVRRASWTRHSGNQSAIASLGYDVLRSLASTQCPSSPTASEALSLPLGRRIVRDDCLGGQSLLPPRYETDAEARQAAERLASADSDDEFSAAAKRPGAPVMVTELLAGGTEAT